MRARPCARLRLFDAGGRRRFRTLSLLLTLSLLSVALAGCAGPSDTPDESTPPGDTGNGSGAGNGTDSGAGGAGNDTGDANDTSGSGGSDTFLVEDLRVEDQDGNETIHEDDRAVVRYTLRHPGTSDEAVTRFVSLAVDGEVVKVDQIRLEADATREMEYELGAMRDRQDLSVEVRVAPTRERLDVQVETWPRTGERVELGPVSVRVNRWLANLEDGNTLVNATISRQADSPDAASPSLARFRASILCADETGTVTSHGEMRPAVPEAGASGQQDLRLPGCEHTLYGVRFTGEVDGEPVERRILFVDEGWRPPASSA